MSLHLPNGSDLDRRKQNSAAFCQRAVSDPCKITSGPFQPEFWLRRQTVTSSFRHNRRIVLHLSQ